MSQEISGFGVPFDTIKKYFEEYWKKISEGFHLSETQFFVQQPPSEAQGTACATSWMNKITFSLHVNVSPDALYRFHLAIFDAFISNIFPFLTNLSYQQQGSFPQSIEEREYKATCRSIGTLVGENVLHRLCKWDKPKFEILRKLSRLTYEKATTTGYIVFQRDTIISCVIAFKERTRITEIKDIRKLIEVSDENLALLFDEKEEAIGLCELNKEEMVYVQFSGRDSFSIGFHTPEPFMSIIEGVGTLIRKPDLGQFKDKIQEIASDENADKILLLLEAARKQSHGTMVVICENAETEVAALGGRCLDPPCYIDPAYITQLASIDGAIYLDPEGKCHAFGVILDGLNCDGVLSARGSRYNSAVKYVSMKDLVGQCIAFVMSEDGGIDVVHNLDMSGDIQANRSRGMKRRHES